MKGKFKLLISGWLIHLSVLLATVILFSFFHRHDQDITLWQYSARHILHKDTLTAAIFTLLVEIAYQYFFKKTNLAWLILVCLLTGALTSLALYGISPPKFFRREMLIDPALITAGYALTYAIVRNYIYTIRRKQDIQLQQFKNELDALKSQLNPHFLFNSLNYLYGTALREKASQTADIIDKLAEMMRYTITGLQHNFVPLEKELKFIAHYITLQQARLPESNTIKVDVQLPTEIPALQIAPLLLLPFIENAFKYGISMDESCFVSINMAITDRSLMMEVHNSINSKPIETEGNNTGVKNTVKRLSLLYPDLYQLEQTPNATEYKTSLSIQLKQ